MIGDGCDIGFFIDCSIGCCCRICECVWYKFFDVEYNVLVYLLEYEVSLLVMVYCNN